MATLLPPPKRLKSAYSQSLKTPPPPTSSTTAPSIVVQFRSAEDGASLGPAINLAADTGRDALQMLVNKLRGEVSHLIPDSRLASGVSSTDEEYSPRTLSHTPSTWYPAPQALSRILPSASQLESRSIPPSLATPSHRPPQPRRHPRSPLRIFSSCGASHKRSSG